MQDDSRHYFQCHLISLTGACDSQNFLRNASINNPSSATSPESNSSSRRTASGTFDEYCRMLTLNAVGRFRSGMRGATDNSPRALRGMGIVSDDLSSRRSGHPEALASYKLHPEQRSFQSKTHHHRTLRTSQLPSPPEKLEYFKSQAFH